MWITKFIPASIEIKSLYTVRREAQIEKELTYLFNLIDYEIVAEAEAELILLQEKYGDTVPELSKASSMINFLK